MEGPNEFVKKIMKKGTQKRQELMKKKKNGNYLWRKEMKKKKNTNWGDGKSL